MLTIDPFISAAAASAVSKTITYSRVVEPITLAGMTLAEVLALAGSELVRRSDIAGARLARHLLWQVEELESATQTYIRKGRGKQ